MVRLVPGAERAGFASDGIDYYTPLGHNLAVFHEFSLSPGHPTGAYVPLYPLLLALIETVRLPVPTSLMIAQALLGAAALVLLYLWVQEIGGSSAAVVATVLAAIVPDFAIYSYLNMSENLFMVLMLAGLVLWQRGVDDEGWAPWGLAGIALGLAALTREYGLTLLVPVAIATWWRRGLRRAAPRMAVMILATGVTLLPWALRNVVVLGEWIPLSTKGAANVYLGTLKGDYHPSDPRRVGALEDPEQRIVDQELRRDLASARSAADTNRLYWRAAWRNVTADPWGQVVYLVRKSGFFWQANVGWRHGARIGHVMLAGLSESAYWLVLLSAAAVVLVRKRMDARSVLPVLLIVWTFAFHVVVGEAESRYHFPLLPSVFVFAGVFLANAPSIFNTTRTGVVRALTT